MFFRGICVSATCRCVVALLSSWSLGFELGSAELLVEFFRFPSDNLRAFCASSFNLGCCVGVALNCGLMRCGWRLESLLVANYGIYVAGLLFNVANSFQLWLLLLAYRVGLGVSCGGFLLTCPLYVMKNSTVDTRGRNLSLVQLNICLGIVLAKAGGMAMLPLPLQYAINGTMATVALASVLFIWPFSCRQTDELLLDVQMVCFSLNLGTVPEPTPAPMTTKDEPRLSLETGQDIGPKDRALPFLDTGQKRVLWLKICACGLLVFFQQLSGINYLFYFAKQLLRSEWLVLGTTLVNLAGSAVNLQIVNLVGRKALLIGGAVVISASYIGMLLAPKTSPYYWVPIYLIIGSFSVTWGPVTNIVVNEICNLNLAILSSAIFENFVLNFVLVNLAPLNHSASILAFVVSSMLLLLFVFLLPETRNSSLTEIEKFFRNYFSTSSTGNCITARN